MIKSFDNDPIMWTMYWWHHQALSCVLVILINYNYKSVIQ